MICQFCGKRVKDNEIICPYCKGDLTRKIDRNNTESHYNENKYEVDYQSDSMMNNSSTRAQGYYSRTDNTDSDMTTIMPNLDEGNTYQTQKLMQDIPKSVRSGNAAKREYYRYNPESRRRQSQSSTRNNHRQHTGTAENMNEVRIKTRKKRRGIIKWFIKFILLALLGIIIGMAGYAVSVSASNWFKSIKNPVESISDTFNSSDKSKDSNLSSDSSDNNKTDSSSNTQNKSSSKTINNEDGNKTSGNLNDTDKINKNQKTESKESDNNKTKESKNSENSNGNNTSSKTETDSNTSKGEQSSESSNKNTNPSKSNEGQKDTSNESKESESNTSVNKDSSDKNSTGDLSD